MFTDRTPESGKPWWREAEVVWLVVLVLVAYFSRAGVLPLRGEEPTRAQIAREMVERGDWIVPREQGEPFLIRPPLQNWLIAASCLALGNWGAWPVRFPSLVAMLLTTLLIYGYCRTFLTRLGALGAGVAFATMVDVFQMGRQAETEALFTLLVSGSLLVWHWGVVRRWPATWTSASGYGLMALAMLTKGIQAPAYFLGGITAYLLLARQGRFLFSRAHAFGALVGAGVLLAWLIPYSLALNGVGVWRVWLGDPAIGYNGGVTHWDPGEVVTHWLTYPLEIAAGTLPWSLLLLPYLHGAFRRSIRKARPQVHFCGVCLAVAFPTCWIPPGGLGRYFAPLFPCLAVLIGLVIQRCAEAEAHSPLRAAWRRYLLTVAGLMVLAALAVLLVTGFQGRHPALAPWAEPPLVALAYAGVSVALAVMICRVREGGSPARVRRAVLVLACFLVLTVTGVLTDGRRARSENAAQAMKALKERLPRGQKLVSLGHTDSLFAYLHGLPFITPRTLPWADPGLPYFCFVSPGNSRPDLPFDWEEIGAVSLDRNHHPEPERVVVVGRRLPLAVTLRGGLSKRTP